jgi:L-rhamnonate dehydratase
VKIVKVEAKYLIVPVPVPVTEKVVDRGALLVTVETDTGIRGIGMAREHDWHCLTLRGILENQLAPYIIGTDPLCPEHLWNEAAWDLSRGDYRVQFGAVSRAASAVDQALWDIRGQYLGQPVYRLLGGSHVDTIDIYITFGLDIYTPEEEAEAARRLLAQGHTAFKLVGAAPNRGQNVEHDAARVKALRETVGDSAMIMIDGRNRYDLYHAALLARQIEPYNVTYFDEPILARDPQAMKELRRSNPRVPIAGRGQGGNIYTNRDLIAFGAVDVIGSNVLDGGGYTQSIKVAHMAEMYQLPLVTGGGFHLQNLHLIAAVNNGWMTEYVVFTGPLCEAIFVDTVKPEKGKLRLSEKPGLGLQLNDAAVREAVARGRVAERK